MIRTSTISFLIILAGLTCYGQGKRDLPTNDPSVWFAAINDPNKPDWEILLQEAKAGEVILSKHEDGKTVVHDTHALRTLTKQKNDIQTTLRELPLDKLEKLGEMLEELKDSA